MKAVKLMHDKRIFADGAIVEMVLWRVPAPVPPSRHPFKYSLYFGRHGVRIVAFDNERGKGDHCHLDGQEYPYHFFSVDQLIDDFLREVMRRLDDDQSLDPDQA
jgi:hypothetical protein